MDSDHVGILSESSRGDVAAGDGDCLGSLLRLLRSRSTDSESGAVVRDVADNETCAGEFCDINCSHSDYLVLLFGLECWPRGFLVESPETRLSIGGGWIGAEEGGAKASPGTFWSSIP